MPAERDLSVIQLAVVLFFDDAADVGVRALRDRLFADSLAPAPENPPIRPHITVAVCSGLDLEQFRPVLVELAAQTPPLACTLASVGAFPTAESVLFLAPTVSHALLQLHEHVIDRMLSSGAEISPYFRTGTWVPHCTLGIGVERARMAAAFAACVEAFQPITVQLTELAAAEIGSGHLAPAHGYALRGLPQSSSGSDA